MTLKTRPVTQKDLDRIAAYHRGEIQKPHWLVDWEKKLEDAQRTLTAAILQKHLDPHQEDRHMHAIVKMMHRRDMLYNIWMEELPFKTWEELATERPPSADDIFRYTVEDTEDHLNGPGVPAFALYLDTRWKGFFTDFAHQCLRECDPLIEESFPMTPEVRHTLSYPEQTFGTSSVETLETRLIQWAREKAPANLPLYVQRLLAANVMVALGNEIGAIAQMEFARCEATEPTFDRMMSEQDPTANIYLAQTQKWQIDVLLKMWPTS